MAKSPVARLIEAVLALEEDVRRAHERAEAVANEITRLGDLLAREMENDLKIVVGQLREEIDREVEAQSRAIRSEYEARIKAELARVERLGRQNMDEAVKAVVEEIIRLASRGAAQ